MTTTKKLVVAVVALSLALVSVVGVTLAYLFDVTGSIENVFNPKSLSVELTETPNKYDMVPGITIAKDPKVTLKTEVPAYVFVKIEETGSVTVGSTTYTFDEFMSYAVADGWIKLEPTSADTPNTNETYVYYKAVDAGNYEIPVLVDNKVTVLTSVTKEMMNGLKTAGSTNYPTLTFTAYATQQLKEGTTNFTPAEAWAVANGK